jgi:hypothetical protein
MATFRSNPAKGRIPPATETLFDRTAQVSKALFDLPCAYVVTASAAAAVPACFRSASS